MNPEQRDMAGEKARNHKGRRFSFIEKIIILCLIAVIASCVGFIAIYASGISGNKLNYGSARNGGETRVVTYERLRNKYIGDEDAATQIIAILPLETQCHNPTIEQLYSQAEKTPSELRVLFLELHSPEGQLQLQKHELSFCAAVIIDGSAFGKLPDGKEIPFIGPVGEKYTVDELAGVLREKCSSNHASH